MRAEQGSSACGGAFGSKPPEERNGKARRRRPPSCTWACLGLAILVAVFALLGPRLLLAWDRGSLRGVEPGMTQAEVRAVLGEPDHSTRSLTDLQGYHGGYFPVPERQPRGVVLVYFSRLHIWKLYVYINHRDRVEDLVWART